jgi:hypothetical protein
VILQPTHAGGRCGAGVENADVVKTPDPKRHQPQPLAQAHDRPLKSVGRVTRQIDLGGACPVAGVLKKLIRLSCTNVASAGFQAL